MRHILLLVLAALLTAFLLAFTERGFTKNTDRTRTDPHTLNKNAVRCSPDWDELRDWLEESDIPPMPGAGVYHWKVSTRNDSAQFYFNQGINMYYGFHIIEAMASFKKAARFDPDCALLYWAQALAYGPNINDYGYIASPDALEALENARRHMGSASPFEQSLIEAMSVRYVRDSADASRAKLNAAYTGRMQKVSEQFPAMPDALVLYTDAMMLEHPWDLWTPGGNPKPWTPRIRQALEKLLKSHPMHPGVNHYYIHVMEASPFADKALPSAARLGITNPGLSHLVHMPSHIYLRTGNYQQGVDVNTAALKSYAQYKGIFPAVSGADFLYALHNLHMKVNNAMMAGQYQVSLDAVRELEEQMPAAYLDIPAPLGNYIQYILSTRVLVYVRFGKWDELLELKDPGSRFPVSSILYHFGRSFALARKKKMQESGQELDLMRTAMQDSSLQVAMHPFSPWIEGAKVAEQMLLGLIHEERNLMEGAIRHYRLADSIESRMVYNEPRDWMLNPRQYLGNAELKAGRWADAERIFRADLDRNRNNGWALLGTWKAQLAGGKKTAAEKTVSLYKRAFSKADISPERAVY